MSSLGTREEFEALAVSKGYDVTRYKAGGYLWSNTRQCWLAWILGVNTL